MELKLSDERCEEIKKIVVQMFIEHNVTCVPINGFEIAQKMRIVVVPYSSKGFRKYLKLIKISEDGFCALIDGVWHIFYNNHKTYGRINNTILHEIAHIVLDHKEPSELAEKEAKFFAKYALVPPVLVHRLKLTSAEEIKEIFEVSDEASEYALRYYRKWLRFGGHDYKDYEIILIEQFESIAIEEGG